MNDDMSYYNFEKLNTYKSKCRINILLYGIFVFLFVLANIIIYFINNNIVYDIFVSCLWILFLNFSLIYLEKTFIKNKRMFSLYKMLYFANKTKKRLCFVRSESLIIREKLTYNSYVFKDCDENLITLFLHTEISNEFRNDTWYDLLLVNNLIYGGVLHD